MVGKTQQEVQASPLPKALREGQRLVQLLVGIEGVTLVNDIRDETEGKRAVNTVTFAMIYKQGLLPIRLLLS